MKTVVQQLLELIPDAAQIKQYMSENDPDEKMLDEWLHEKIYKGKDWIALEKEQIVDAYDDAKSCVCLQCDDMKDGCDFYKKMIAKN